MWSTGNSKLKYAVAIAFSEKNFFSELRKDQFWDLCYLASILMTFQSAFTCSKLTIETLEQGVKYVQS